MTEQTFADSDRGEKIMLRLDSRGGLRRSGLLALVTALATFAAVPLAGTHQRVYAGPPEDAVLDWNLNATNALVNSPTAPIPGLGQSPTVSILHLAMAQGAVYDAVNMIDGGHEPYLEGLPPAPASASHAAAVATAAHDVLVGVVEGVPVISPLTPAIIASIVDRLDDLYADSIAAATVEDGAAAVAAGTAAGGAAAEAMLEERANDGRFGPFRFTSGDDPGEWRPTTPGVSDPFAWVARVDPFVLESTSQFRTKGPHALTSGAYTKEYNEVKELGALDSPRTPEQNALANFYTNNVPPPELFNRTFRVISESEGLTLVEQARLFVMLNMAGADALINCWDDKAVWSFWRPVTAIHEGDDDGNRRTIGDPGWTPLSGNPPYPEHPSGYNCATSAFMHTADAFFGRKPLAFSVVRIVAGEANVTRNYNQFKDVIDDTIDARIYQGIHFRAADVQGAEIGKDVARWLDKHFFQLAK
jgi:hypothetical protein